MLGLGCSGIQHAKAQIDSLRNGDFETWVDRSKNGTTYSDPEFWYTLNSLTAFGMEPTTWVSSNAKSGLKAVYLETTSQTFGVIPGILACNNFLDASGDPDLELNRIPFDTRPTKINFWYKSNPAIGDSSAFNFTLTKFKNNAHQVIGTATWSNGSSDSTYKKVSIYFEYFSNDLPDSASIIFTSSINGFDPIAGSTLLLDQISLDYEGNSLKEISKHHLDLYPNPSEDGKFYFSNEYNFKTCKVYEMQGALVSSIDLFNNEINLDKLKSGIYFLNLLNDKSQNYTSKIIIK